MKKNSLIFCLLSILNLSIFSLSSNPVYYTKSPKYHFVRKGETLVSISSEYGISPKKLKLYNNLQTEEIFTGQKIYLIPCSNHKSEFVTQRKIPSSKFYIVKPKETLYRISKMFGIDLLDLAEFNDLSSFNLSSGQKLWLESGHSKIEKSVSVKEKVKNKKTVTKKKNILVQENFHLKIPVIGDVSSEFGIRNGHQHNGIDIAASVGTPIYAVLDGTVAFVGLQKGYGNVIILEHENYTMTVYAHNETNLVRLGDKVKKGQPIATVGETGTVTGPHLHFEYRKKGRAINPREVLPDL